MRGTNLIAELEPGESAQLRNCETVIARGIHAFNEVGNALMRVRDGRLYRGQFGTFEAYCEQRWKISERRANQLVGAAAVSEMISGTVVPEINNEAQARELAPLLDDPDELRRVWDAANAQTGGKPTAAAIRSVRNESEPNPTPAEPASPDLIPPSVPRWTDGAQETLDEHVPDPEAPQRELRKQFRRVLDGVARVRDFDTAAVAKAMDDDDLRQLEIEVDLLVDYYRKITAARRQDGNVVLFRKPVAV